MVISSRTLRVERTMSPYFSEPETCQFLPLFWPCDLDVLLLVCPLFLLFFGVRLGQYQPEDGNAETAAAISSDLQRTENRQLGTCPKALTKLLNLRRT